ncbi:MAG: hypothetical protein CVU87_02710 [Firmicutes bacterium HGW-Firmicutes-12]|nr:MAG: hypothetical protein CVU87_02710 [Firmicutes bacterium HGW-Firmicutes-12]
MAMGDNEQLVKRAKTGDKTAVLKLYQNNLGLIKKICNSVAADEKEFEDFEQEAFFAIIKAAAGYDYERGYMFSSYFGKVLIRHLQRYRRYHGCKEALTLNEPFEDGEGNTKERIDSVQDPNIEDSARGVEIEYLRAKLDQALSKLPERRACLTEQHYGYECSTSELALAFGMTVKEVKKELRLGRDRMNRLLLHVWREWTNDYWEATSYCGTGLLNFRLTHTSSTERTVLNIVNIENRLFNNR